MDKRGPASFDVFKIDPAGECLWRGSEKIHLRPKTFAFLQYMAERPGKMVSKEQLLKALWRDCYVGEGALKYCVSEIRRALQDTSESPRFIETVHRRGYRFIAKMNERRLKSGPQVSSLDRCSLVGRKSELTLLQQFLENAMAGAKRIAFITGEQGIGKTALVDAFLKSVSSESSEVLVARGQCFRAHGTGEAYMPFCEVITGLCQMPQKDRIVPILHQYAPLWLLQVASCSGIDRVRDLPHAAFPARRERTLREMAEALEALAREIPLILVLEDLHWSDYSTLDLVSYLAQRRQPTRLLLIATYRPTEALAEDHPLRNLKTDLSAREYCHELPLSYLNEGAIDEYLGQRFKGNSFPDAMASWIYRRTEGNPLFIVNVLNHLVERGLISQHHQSWTLNLPLDRAEFEVPPSIQGIIERQIEQCPADERRHMEAASVFGLEFSISALASVLQERADQVQRSCRKIAERRLFLEPVETRNVVAAGRDAFYKFRHGVYQSILYQQLTQDWRAELHSRAAEYIEKSNRKHLDDVAARLAMHFEQGRKYRRAIQYYQRAASNANWRYAGREAVELAERGIQLLDSIPSFAEKPGIEMSLQVTLGNGLLVIRGLGAAEKVEHAFHQATSLFKQLREHRRSQKGDLQFGMLRDLWYYNWRHADYAAARDLAEQMLKLAQAGQDSTMLAQAHYAFGRILMNHGKFAGALRHLKQCPTVVSRIYAALTMWKLGYPDRAMKFAEDALTLALAEQNPEGCVMAYMGNARIHLVRGEGDKVLLRAQAALDVARQQNLVEVWLNPTKMMLGWGLARLGRMDEGIEMARQALADEYRVIGFTHITPFLLSMLAEMLGDAGQADEGLTIIQEAFERSHSSDITSHHAEIHRIKGELLVQTIASDAGGSGEKHRKASEAEICFNRAIHIARQQRAKSFELRAATGLAALLRKQDRIAEARQLLKSIHDWFSEGHDTLDLRRAQQLIGELDADFVGQTDANILSETHVYDAKKH